MSRRRYVSTDVSTDKRLNRLGVEHGDFAVMLYSWMIPHAADDATLNGDLDEFMAIVLPMRRDKTPAEVREAIEAMVKVGLLTGWDGEKIYFPTEAFYRYQTYIKADNRRIGDVFVALPESPETAESKEETAVLNLTPENAEERRKTPTISEEQRETPQNADDQRKTPENAVSLSLPPSPSPSPSPSLPPSGEAAFLYQASEAQAPAVAPPAPLRPSKAKNAQDGQDGPGDSPDELPHTDGQKRAITATTASVRPKRRGITDADIARWEGEHPTVDIRAFVDDYLNWAGSAKHVDKVRGFENQLRITWKCDQFSRYQPAGRMNGHGRDRRLADGRERDFTDDPEYQRLKALGVIVE